METQEHILLINGLVIQAQGGIPGGGAALGGGEVLHRMERKCGEVRKAAGALSVALGADAVGSVSHHGHPADLPLQVTLGGEQGLLILRNGEDRVVIRQDAAHVHGNHRLGALCKSSRKLLRIHLIGPRQSVHQHQLGTHMAHGAGGGGVGIGGGDDLVPGADAQDAQSHLQTGSGGVEAHGLIRAAVSGDLPLKLLGLGSGGDPAGTQSLANLLNFSLRNIRRAKRYFVHKIPSFLMVSPKRAK